eukprot:CAMPEP_0179979856 /NCGR_PEP_ID=MMETSP0983-20121128/41595_1 /TAXON_ID=483367 /ORGANISM="non described non described, Strain CCMP 2436" /LENGTH=145 /DNA_ID=CAMNT_0021897697 /DNA_START=433 /DNA_END=870 /DNA_ORIENTATION=-
MNMNMNMNMNHGNFTIIAVWRSGRLGRMLRALVLLLLIVSDWAEWALCALVALLVCHGSGNIRGAFFLLVGARVVHSQYVGSSCSVGFQWTAGRNELPQPGLGAWPPPPTVSSRLPPWTDVSGDGPVGRLLSLEGAELTMLCSSE